MKSKEGILAALAPLYREMGKEPQELVDVRPSHGGWLNALWFEIVRADGATTRVSREALDRDDLPQLTNALWSFRAAPDLSNRAAGRDPFPADGRNGFRRSPE